MTDAMPTAPVLRLTAEAPYRGLSSHTPVIIALIAGGYGAWYYHGGFLRPALIAAEITAAVIAVVFGVLGGASSQIS